MSEFIREQFVRGRKHHRCYHCYRHIVPGELHRKGTYKGEGVYSLRFHLDCQALWDRYFKDAGLREYDFDDGYPPLHDDWSESGEIEKLCDAYRGFSPHAVTRIEHNLSDAEDRYQARLSAATAAVKDGGE